MNQIQVKKRNGRLEPLDVSKINKCVERACAGLEDVSVSSIVLDANVKLYNRVTTSEIDQAMVSSAASKIERDPNYDFVAARLFANTVYKEVFGEGVDSDAFELQYHKAFISNLRKLVKADRINPELLTFDLKTLAEALVPDRDNLFRYQGIKTLYDRYFIHIDGRRMESPQGFWMRIAMGLALAEKPADRTFWSLKFYEQFSNLNYLPSTPTLFNSGTLHSQLSSCYLSCVSDSLHGIFGNMIHQQAALAKFAGGQGLSITPIRATGSYVKGTNGKSNGIVPWAKIFNDTMKAVDQGSKRPGAGVLYLEPWHLDIEAFIDLRRNTGDDRIRTHDINTAVWIPDLFMKCVEQDHDWYLFCPSENLLLHETFGTEFETHYSDAIDKANAGDLKNFQVVSAKALWKKILRSIAETGYPWITFKDPSNIRYSNSHEGVIHSSNLCTEVFIHSKPTEYDSWGNREIVGETAVCTLSSLNLPKFLNGKNFDLKKLAETIEVAIRGLDNTIDINFYPTPEAQNANLKHRPLGLGTMGVQDMLFHLDLQYDSEEGAEFSGWVQECVAFNAIKASALLAKERGVYETYEGSSWSQGLFPQDTYTSMMESRVNDYQPAVETLPWDEVRDLVKEHGMRNSLTQAIAPTETISKISGTSRGIDPYQSVLFSSSDASGDFTVINHFFADDMKKLGLWNQNLVDAIKRVNGDLELLDLPKKIRDKYKKAFQMDVFMLLQAAAKRQIWIDQGQSLNIYNATLTGSHMNKIYMTAWKLGLKTTYYHKSEAASGVEKSTVSAKAVESESIAIPEMKAFTTEVEETFIKACRIDDPSCESCQ